MLTRRDFGKSLAAVATMALAGSSVFIAGCSSATALLNALINSAQSLLALDPTATWAQQLSAAISALKTAEASWAAGGAVVIVEDALNTLETVLAVIPATAAYSPLVDIVVAGIEAVLNVLFPSTSSSPVTARARLAPNPHRGAATLHKPHFMQTEAGAYMSQFNSKAKELGLPQAQIR